MSHWGVTPQPDFMWRIADRTEAGWLPRRKHSEGSPVASGSQNAKGNEEHLNRRTLHFLRTTAEIHSNFKCSRWGLKSSLTAQIWIRHTWDYQTLFHALERKQTSPLRLQQDHQGTGRQGWSSMRFQGPVSSPFACASVVKSNCIKTLEQASLHTHCCQNTPLVFINAAGGRLDFFFLFAQAEQ